MIGCASEREMSFTPIQIEKREDREYSGSVKPKKGFKSMKLNLNFFVVAINIFLLKSNTEVTRLVHFGLKSDWFSRVFYFCL